jgi:hypothetical protein
MTDVDEAASREVNREGFWYSPREPKLPMPVETEGFEDQGIYVRLLHLLQTYIKGHYDESRADYDRRYKEWFDNDLPIEQRPSFDYYDVQPGNQGAYIMYRGSSHCRICGSINGSAEFMYSNWCWPSGYMHYIEYHGVEPSQGFKAMLNQAALDMANPSVHYAIEICEQPSTDKQIKGVRLLHSEGPQEVILLSIDLNIKRAPVTAIGSTTINGKDVPIVYLDTNDGDDGDDTGVVLLAYPGHSVFAAQSRKYAVNVCLIKQ